MAQLARTRRQLEKEAIIKVFNDSLQRYETVIIPSGITIGVAAAGFDKGIKLNGPIAFQTTTAPASTSMKLYVVGSTLYFDGSEVGSGGGGAPTDAQYVTLATDSTLTDERVLTAGSNITITDGGAGSTVTIAASAAAGGWTDDGTDVRLTTSTDKVGIGTASPGTKLEIEVADSENLGGLLIDFNETGGYNALKIDSESTSYFGASVYGKYGIRAEQDLSGGQALFVTRDIAEAGSFAMAVFHDDNTSNTQTTVTIRQDGTGDIFTLHDGGTEVFTVLDGGNVGIGTDAPSTVLHVEGGAVTIGNGSTGPGEIRLLEDTDLGTYYAGFKAGNLTENTAYEMPTALPASDKVLQSDSAGALSWVTRAAPPHTLDVGWTAPAADEIATTGSLAIGIATSPAERLEIEDADGTATTLQISNSGAGDPQLAFALSGTKKFTLGVDDTDGDKFKLGTTAVSTNTVLTIDMATGGQVGFGTTSPAEAMEIETGYATTTLQLSNTAADGDPQLAFALSGTKKFTMGVDDGDSDKFKIGTTAIGTNTRLTINAAGAVGIATSSPVNRVQIDHAGSNGDDGLLVIRADSSTVDGDLLGGIGFDSTDGNVPSSITEAAAFIAAYAAENHGTGDKGGDLVFGTTTIDDNDDTTSHEWMRILDSGKVGIGTASPATTLHVKDSSPGVRIQREAQTEDGTLDFAGAAGVVGASITHAASTNDLVFSSYNGSSTEEILRLGSYYNSSNRQVILLSGSAMAAGSMQPKQSTDINFFVSGAMGSKDSSTKGTSVFGGDVLASGSLYAGTVIPIADNIYDLGSPSRRYSNIYTGDLHLQNERGHWQIIEERDYLCVVNRLTGKRYKMALEPMDDDE